MTRNYNANPLLSDGNRKGTQVIPRSVNEKKLPLVILTLALCLAPCLNSCKKLVTVPAPATQISSANVYSNDATATAVLNELYIGYSKYAGIQDLTLYTALSSDEFNLFQSSAEADYQVYYANLLSAQNARDAFWTKIYNFIFVTNAALEGLNQATTLTPAVKQQLLGEAAFNRAFCYFYLVNLYGDVPLALSTDYKVNASLARASKDQVYKQIITDLTDAEKNLSADYLDATLLNVSSDKFRPTKWAAKALLARAYLYHEEWSNAAQEASSLIDNSPFAIVSLNEVFTANSGEAIWQLQQLSTLPYNMTPDGREFLLPATGINETNPTWLSPFVVGAFENGDQRSAAWVNSVAVNGTIFYYPWKYKNNQVNSGPAESETVFRLAEQYLIRAEAEAHTPGGINAAVNDLNVIRNRAGLPAYNGAAEQSPLLDAILHERQVELFAEWGHRWFDLKRTGTIDAVMSVVCPQKGGNVWQSYRALYPIPAGQLALDVNLRQNPGY